METDRRTHTDRHRQTDRQTDRQAGRQREVEILRNVHNYYELKAKAVNEG